MFTLMLVARVPINMQSIYSGIFYINLQPPERRAHIGNDIEKQAE